MKLFKLSERVIAEAVTAISATNPFRPERVTLERTVLGEDYEGADRARALSPDDTQNPNAARVLARVEVLLGTAREALLKTKSVPPDELRLYQGLAFFALYYRFETRLADLAEQTFSSQPGEKHASIAWYEEFRQQSEALLRPGKHSLPEDMTPAHLLAILFQIARAYHQIFAHILGTSNAAVELRAAVWESIFSHDLLRYQRSLFDHMADLATLVTGPSGTGKELVARAIGTSSYIPFDEKRKAFPPVEDLFLPLNLTALSPHLIESELFGHRRGAFTGALADRPGWFETCPPYGAVFLDEIGEIDPSIQVKLLRVLQTRTFQRLGDTTTYRFQGKLVSATNRDLGEEMAAGRFREDLYYRICSDRVVTPSLAEQVQGSMAELRHLVLFIAKRLVADEAGSLADEVLDWVENELGADYPWPGNFRELEQCVRNILLRRAYRPEVSPRPQSIRNQLQDDFLQAELSADDILRRYCTLVYTRTGTFDGAARVLDLDRRTVKAKLDLELAEKLAGTS